jgi:nitroimidazol reductase NimA-like FMN-containing flavoprotein (pyridoxamine 5'-phosphate oxidase superfamily)
MRYVSVIAFGKARIVDDPLSKRHALDILMRHYSDFSFDYPDEALSGMIIIQVDINSMTGKRSG